MSKQSPKHRRITIQQRHKRRRKMRKIKAVYNQSNNHQRKAELERKFKRMSPTARLEEIGSE